ncbi:MAG TPA: capsule assembly Wzi family protein [Prolixibacteraceae bacterium]|nr:capsule assembly Wzi family protein [Prolixibacteraceae bacterium]
MKFFCLIILFFTTSLSFAQSRITDAVIETTGLVGSGNDLPFWMTHNQLGKYSSTGNGQELTEGTLFGETKLSGNLSLTYGADLALLISQEGIDPKIIQAYLGLSGKVIRLQAGAFADEELLGGLSSSNGDLLRSRNYRPYPKVRLSTPGFIPFFIAKSWFRLNAEYDEGILTDERAIDRPHLHHKSLMIRALINPSLRFTAGMNHYVFWGGSSDQTGQLPNDLKSYFRYIAGSSGSSEFVSDEQKNVAGNQLGSYLITVEKDFENFQLEIRASHPFEDHSGMEFDNIKDNLYTFHFRKNKTGSFLDEFLFEYLYSKHQSGNRHQLVGPKEEHMRGLDNYFNHYIYQTGYTYLGQSMGTPLFEPIRRNHEGVVSGVANNRVSAFHFGAKGYVSKNLKWKGMITYSRNFGTYAQPYNAVRQQTYSLGELSWKCQNHPLLLSAILAVDLGHLTQNQTGIGLQAQWTLR